jgi:membrane fusion protein (multidrug efflux system)
MQFMHVSVSSPARFFCLSSLLLASLSIGVFSGCGPGAHATTAEKPKTPELPVISAAVLEVQPAIWPAVVRTQGSLAADEVAIVGAKVAGRVNEVNFDLGDAIRGGMILARLDQDDFKLQVILAESQLTQSRAALGLRPQDPLESLDPNMAPPVREAKAVWDETRARIARVRQLQIHSRNTVTQEEYDQAVAAEAAAEARHAAAINAVREKIAQISVRSSELEVAKQHFTDTVVHAPFDGLVQERHVAHGSFVQLGDPIATLVRTSVVRFHGTMPERHAHRLQMGQQVKLKIEGFEEPRLAKITRISPTVEEMSRSLAFEALVDNRNGDLRTGLFAEAEVMVDPAARSLIVPASAIMEFAGAEKVWKLVNGVAKETVVRTARHGERGVEIIAGLVPGDLILAKATEGRVARIDAIAAPPQNNFAEPTEATAAEEVEPQESITPTSARVVR